MFHRIFVFLVRFEYSYIVLGDLFTFKLDFSQFDFCFLFMFASFPLLKGRQNPLSNSNNCNVTKMWSTSYLDNGILLSGFPSEIKNCLLIQFSLIWLILSKKAPIINCLRNTKSFNGIYFYLQLKSWVFLKKSFCLFPGVNYSFSNCPDELEKVLEKCPWYLFLLRLCGFQMSSLRL